MITIVTAGFQRLSVLQVSYCEEQVDCRRVMIMAHFGELNFAARHCHKTCDNCLKSAGANHETRDMTQVTTH